MIAGTNGVRTTRYCEVCQGYTMHENDSINAALIAAVCLTIFTCGIGIVCAPILVLVSTMGKNNQCLVCGSKR
jgi:hypothetical protein